MENTIGDNQPASHFKLSIKIAALALGFWLVQFLYQYYLWSIGDLGLSLVRSFAFSGTSLIGLALLTSIVFKFFPVLADHWRVRRYLGVSGVVLIFGHFIAAMTFVFDFNPQMVYWSLNPFENPVVFGSAALFLFTLMALTSSDRAYDYLGYKKWKMLHRVVYFAWLFAVFHFMFISPAALQSLPGYLLIIITILVLSGQLYWWIKIAGRKRFITWGGLVGILIIALYVIFTLIMKQWI